MQRRFRSLLLSLAALLPWAAPPVVRADVVSHRAVLSAEQVVQILDETVDWYRTLGAQQQNASQPSDLLMLYANRQTADKVIALAFEIARANAELLSSEADLAQGAGQGTSAAQSLQQVQRRLDAQRQSIQGEIDQQRRELATARNRTAVQDKLAELQGELDMVNARRNLLDTMYEFSTISDSRTAKASALKAQIDAIAASIPSLSPATGPAAAAATAAQTGASPPSLTEPATPGKLGIWDLASNVLRLSRKIHTLDSIDKRTASLQETFDHLRAQPLEQLKSLAARSDALAAQADNSTGSALRGVRDEFDTLAWLFKQTSSILIPLTRESVLLNQYRHNLTIWRAGLDVQYHDALKTLAVRAGFLALMLAVVFGIAELWRRAVFRYAHETRRRQQLLLVRRIVLWAVVLVIVGMTFASELGSLVTFAGLITAGLAVAMQSILVSVVGYFFLIGKYGIRVGDRVQIGNVTGEVIELGLVRMHLMELNDRGVLGPTGRVVGFANSIVFQASGGLFKQIPGVNIAWHETTLKLPGGCDPEQVKMRMLEVLGRLMQEYKVEIDRQAQEIRRTTASEIAGDAKPSVQLKFSTDGVEAHVRYPVHLEHAAEIDERVSRELLAVISSATR
ncbi:MAG: mechanosensitive ion channel [Steroidobacteraceae bacterium]